MGECASDAGVDAGVRRARRALGGRLTRRRFVLARPHLPSRARACAMLLGEGTEKMHMSFFPTGPHAPPP
eukprot:5418807-Pyramimonas_sp.AAC.1